MKLSMQLSCRNFASTGGARFALCPNAELIPVWKDMFQKLHGSQLGMLSFIVKARFGAFLELGEGQSLIEALHG